MVEKSRADTMWNRKGVWSQIVISCLATGAVFGNSVDDKTPIAEEMQSILEVKLGQNDLRDAWATAVSAFSGKGVDPQPAVERLVQQSLNGVDPDAFARLVARPTSHLKRATVPDRGFERYGTEGDRMAVIDYVLLYARSMATKSPVTAREWARAAMLLSTYEGSIISRLKLRTFWLDDDKPTIADISGVSGRQRDAVNALLDKYLEPNDRTVQPLLASAKSVDGYLSHADAIKSEPDVKKTIQAFQDNRAIATDLPEAYRLLQEVWRFRNMCVAANAQGSLTQVDEFLNGWSAKADSQTIRRWIHEVLTQVEPPSDQPVVHVLQPDDPRLRPTN